MTAETVIAPASRIVPFDDLLRKPRWLVADLIPAGGIAAIYDGSGELGDSTVVALDIALAVAAGRPWGECATPGGPVVYAAGAGVAGIPRRVAATCEMHGTRASLPFTLLAGLSEPAEIRAAISQAGISPALIVIDQPLCDRNRRFAQGVRDLADAFGAAVLVASYQLVECRDVTIRVDARGPDLLVDFNFDGESRSIVALPVTMGSATVVADSFALR